MYKIITKFKNFLIVTFIIGNLTCCDKNDNISIEITNGIYMGYFDYQDSKYWCEIDFDSRKYEEWPSGGAAYQKSMSCLTVGEYSILGNKITFMLDSIKYTSYFEPCVSDMLLPGEYTIHNTNKADSIIFERGKDSNEIKYYLKRLIIDE